MGTVEGTPPDLEGRVVRPRLRYGRRAARSRGSHHVVGKACRSRTSGSSGSRTPSPWPRNSAEEDGWENSPWESLWTDLIDVVKSSACGLLTPAGQLVHRVTRVTRLRRKVTPGHPTRPLTRMLQRHRGEAGLPPARHRSRSHCRAARPLRRPRGPAVLGLRSPEMSSTEFSHLVLLARRSDISCSAISDYPMSGRRVHGPPVSHPPFRIALFIAGGTGVQFQRAEVAHGSDVRRPELSRISRSRPDTARRVGCGLCLRWPSLSPPRRRCSRFRPSRLGDFSAGLHSSTIRTIDNGAGSRGVVHLVLLAQPRC